MNYLQLINEHVKNNNCIFCIENELYNSVKNTIKLLDDWETDLRYYCTKCSTNYNVALTDIEEKNLSSIIVYLKKYSISFNINDVTIHYWDFSEKTLTNAELYDEELTKYITLPYFKIEKWNIEKLEQKIKNLLMIM